MSAAVKNEDIVLLKLTPITILPVMAVPLGKITVITYWYCVPWMKVTFAMEPTGAE